MPDKATLEQSINPAVQTQKEKLLQELLEYRQGIDNMIQNLQKAQTTEEILGVTRQTLQKIVQKA